MKKQNVTIAVVEDHALMRQCTCFRLSTLGYNVALEAENGKRFLDHLNGSCTPDICLLDIDMPVMNGFETIRHLKKGWPEMKVVFLSMHNESWYYQKAMQLGADGFVCKDASCKELEGALLKIIYEEQAVCA